MHDVGKLCKRIINHEVEAVGLLQGRGGVGHRDTGTFPGGPQGFVAGWPHHL